MSFYEELERLRKAPDKNPLVAALRGWLDAERERFCTVALHGDDVELLENPQLGGWQVRKPRSLASRMLTHPSEELPGSRCSEPGCNLGFRVIEDGRIKGHFVWPVAFNREFVRARTSLTPHQVRQELVKLGHLHTDAGRTTTHLPRALAKVSAQGQPRRIVKTHSSGGLEYRTPVVEIRENLRVRTLALRGLYPA